MPQQYDKVMGNEKTGINRYLGIQYLYVTLSDYSEKLNSIDYYQQLLKHKTRMDHLTHQIHSTTTAAITQQRFML